MDVSFCVMFSFPEAFGSGSSGGNVLVPARTLRRNRLKGRCRKAAPLRIPRPLRRNCPKIFRVAMGVFVGDARIGQKAAYQKTRLRKTGGGFSSKGIFIKSPSFSLTEQYFFAEKGSFFSGLYSVSIPPLFFRKKPGICGGKRHELCLRKEKADFPRKPVSFPEKPP